MFFNRIFCIFIVFLSIESITQSMICPDMGSKCRDGMTCCGNSSGNYFCCPLISGHCCSDGLHCCPNGTHCNEKEGTCDVVDKQIGLESNELCPDRNKTCFKYETCCKERTGGYGCCPYDSGVCCKDLLHCCPHGSECDLIHKQCIRPSNRFNDNHSVNVYQTMKLIGFSARNISFIVCPGAQSDCPDGNTCCPINKGQWGCCPLENAVCCEDRMHCCPNRTICTQSGCQSKSDLLKKYI